MDIERIARKLEPLMPSKVRHWLKVRDMADQELRELIDKQIVQTAYNILGDFRKKILLSLPPEELSRGEIHLGNVLYEMEKWEFGLSRGELCQHIAVFGRSGAGKTNVVFHILEQLSERGIPFLFLDWKRTARHLLPRLKTQPTIYTPGRQLSPMSFNPFSLPPGLESNVYAQQVVDVLANAYTLGDGAKSLLQKALGELYSHGRTSLTPRELLEALQSLDTKGRAQGWKLSAVRALETLSQAALAEGDLRKQKQLAQELLEQSTILELDSLSDSSKKFLIPLLCVWLFSVKMADRTREKLSLVVVLEEAHHVLHRGSRNNIMEQFLRQCRELGIGIVIVDQHPSLISQAALGNCYTTICLNLKDPSDINKAAALCLLDEDEKDSFSMLPIGQGIMKMQDRWRRAFLLQFPLLAVEKGAVDDQVVSDYLKNPSFFRRSIQAKNNILEPLGLNNSNLGTLGRSPMSDKVFSEEGMIFLRDILEFPDSGVDERYKRLHMSVEKGNRLKNELIKTGALESLEVLSGRTRKVILRPTAKAREELGLKSENVTRESIAHEYWKRFYARLFEEKGYQVTLEASRRNGRVDVLAVKPAENGTRASESVAIEVETGKSNVVWNVKQDLLSAFDRVLVVATDKEALRIVEWQLAKALLLGMRRVEVLVVAQQTA